MQLLNLHLIALQHNFRSYASLYRLCRLCFCNRIIHWRRKLADKQLIVSTVKMVVLGYDTSPSVSMPPLLTHALKVIHRAVGDCG